MSRRIEEYQTVYFFLVPCISLEFQLCHQQLHLSFYSLQGNKGERVVDANRGGSGGDTMMAQMVIWYCTCTCSVDATVNLPIRVIFAAPAPVWESKRKM
jgi:hypothetical protein